MPVSQRVYDLMQLQAQIRINKLVEDWRRQFLRGRLPEMMQQLSEQLPAPGPSTEDVRNAIY